MMLTLGQRTQQSGVKVRDKPALRARKDCSRSSIRYRLGTGSNVRVDRGGNPEASFSPPAPSADRTPATSVPPADGGESSPEGTQGKEFHVLRPMIVAVVGIVRFGTLPAVRDAPVSTGVDTDDGLPRDPAGHGGRSLSVPLRQLSPHTADRSGHPHDCFAGVEVLLPLPRS